MVNFYGRLRDICFDQLMFVYSEALEENATELYATLNHAEGIMLARQDFYQYLQEVFFPTKDACYAVLEQNGRYVSALRVEPYRDGLLMEAVETAPEYRRKGYACSLVEQTVSMLSEKYHGKLYSHVSKRNYASIQLHKHCGFQILSEYARYIDGSVNDRAFTFVREI